MTHKEILDKFSKHYSPTYDDDGCEVGDVACIEVSEALKANEDYDKDFAKIQKLERVIKKMDADFIIAEKESITTIEAKDKEIAATEKICSDHVDTIDKLQKEITELKEAANELIQIKDWKDKHGKDTHYIKNVSKCWTNLKKLLSCTTKQKQIR